MNQPIVVGVDGSVSALHATRWAAKEADRRGTELRLVYASVHPPLVPDNDLYLDELREQGRERLAEAASAAREVAPDLKPHRDLVVGSPSSTLVGASASASLVVLGSRGLGGFRGMLVGSVAVTLAAHGHCPVVVVRGRTLDDPPPELGPVVLGVDGSPISDEATAFAFEAAASRAADLTAVHVWNDAALAGAWTAVPVLPDLSEVDADLRRLLDERLSPWRPRYPSVTVETVLAHGHPATALVDYTERAQLIVVGSRGRGNIAGLGGLGSISQSLVHHAHCPVAILRAGLADKAEPAQGS